MQFADHGGHIFTVKSYRDYPIGYEYETTPYIFWIDDEYNTNLSTECYYIKPIYVLVTRAVKDIDISIDSDVFSFIPSNITKGMDSIHKYLEINESELTKHIGLEDVVMLGNVRDDTSLITYNMFPIYVIASTKDEGSWISNILIHLTYEQDETYPDLNDEYCPISIGGVFKNECEELIINSRNMGISLPKDIIRAVYQGSYYNDTINEELYTKKMKEYFINYMGIRGECGNYNSAINALKWFGYGKHIEISQLLATDNKVMEQYINDYLSIHNDIIETYKYFRSVSYISLRIKENAEDGSVEHQDFDADFWGEGLPQWENLFNKSIYVSYDEDSGLLFEAPYYNFIFDELAIKLTCLRYYYQKYFLPMHIHIHSAAVQHSEFAQPIKFVTDASTTLTELPILAGDEERYITFDDTDTYFLYNQEYILDDILNNMSSYARDKESDPTNLYLYINDICAAIPIHFKKDKLYNCVFLLSKNGRQFYESHFSFYNCDECEYNKLVLSPKFFNNDFDVEWWEDGIFRLDILCNDVWYSHTFKVRTPELQLTMGCLNYVYDNDYHRQVNEITDTKVDFNNEMYTPSIATINDINFLYNVERAFNFASLTLQDEYDTALVRYSYYWYGLSTIISFQQLDDVVITMTLKKDDNIDQVIDTTKDDVTVIYDDTIYHSEKTSTGGFRVKVPIPEEVTDTTKMMMNVIITRSFINTVLGKDTIEFNYTAIYNPNANDCPFNCELNDPTSIWKCKHKTYNGISSSIYIDRNGVTSDDAPVFPVKETIYNDIQKKDIEKLIRNYCLDVSVSKKPKYLNRVILFDLFAKNNNGLLVRKRYRKKEDIISIYRTFFNDDGSPKTFGNGLDKVLTKYDMYIMHDTSSWHCILISKYTIDKYGADDEGMDELGVDSSYYINDEWKMEYRSKSDMMQINRLVLTASDGVNHFHPDDIVVVSMDNVNLPYVFTLGSKWDITKNSIGKWNTKTVKSYTNTAIVELDAENDEYKKGYYNITCHYSLDAHIQHRQDKIGVFRIVE